MLFDEDIEIIIESDVFINASGVNEFSKIDIVEVDTNEDIIIVQISESTALVQSVNGKIGFVNIDKTDIGLSNVENVSILSASGYLDSKITNLSNNVVYTTGYQEISGYKYFSDGLDSNYLAIFPYGSDNSAIISLFNNSGGAVDLSLDNFTDEFNIKLPGKNGTLLTDQDNRILFTSGVQIISGLKIVSGQYPPSDEYSIDDIRESGAYFFIDDAERFQYYIIAPASENTYVKFGPYSLGKLHKDTADLFFTTNGLVNTTNSLSNEISGVSGELQTQINTISGDYYSNSNPSGFITGIDLSAYVTKSSGAFTNRPTVNGTGVLLSGEAAGLPTTIVYTTGNQTISGTKNFVTRPQVNNIGVVISGEAYPSNNPSGFITGVDLTSYATKTNLETTGSTLNTKIDNFSGTVTSNYVTKTNGEFTNRPTVNGTGILLNGESAEYVFPDNLIVSLSSGKTFGRYRNGETILSSGKTTSQVLQLAIVEPIIPNVLLTTSSSIAFNQTGINNILNASNTINSLNASLQTGYIEWRRGGVGAWTQLTGNTLTGFSFVHSLTDTNFNTSGFNYRYIVTDTVSATNTGNLTITPTAYVSPTLSSTSIGVTPADLGNISGTLSTTINRNSLNVNLTGYQLQYQTGVSWVNIGSLTLIPSSPHSLNVIHNDSSLRNINSINYRIQVYDQYQLTALTMGTRSFLYRNYLGYSPNTSLTLSEIESLVSSTLSNSKSRTIANVTAGAGNYTYYCYRAGAGDLTSIIQDGAAPVLGAFTKLSDVNGLNTYGANVTYIVYRSNATNAFTNNTLAFS